MKEKLEALRAAFYTPSLENWGVVLDAVRMPEDHLMHQYVKGHSATLSQWPAHHRPLPPDAPPWLPQDEAAEQMIFLKGGTYTMGSPPDEEGRWDDEEQQEATVGDFAIGRYQVTQELYESVMGENPSHFRGPRRPVETVSWYDAIRFCNKLSEMRGLTPAYTGEGELTGGDGYRLPFEAEWEYACRAGTTGARYGDLDDIAWYWENSGGETHPVGERQPNAWGLCDTLGNVWEWCQDRYAKKANANPTVPAPSASTAVGPGTTSRSSRVRRTATGGPRAPASSTWAFASPGGDGLDPPFAEVESDLHFASTDQQSAPASATEMVALDSESQEEGDSPDPITGPVAFEEAAGASGMASCGRQSGTHQGTSGATSASESSGGDMPDPTSSLRVGRGGSWGNPARFVRTAFRYWISPGSHYCSLGLRLARVAT